MSQASVYQHLRSHLAYLRPPGIAEVLPNHLDRGQQKKLSPTALLEELFRLLTTSSCCFQGVSDAWCPSASLHPLETVHQNWCSRRRTHIYTEAPDFCRI